MLKFVYDPDIITGISKRKFEKEVSVKPTCEIKSLSDLYAYFETHNTGSNEDIANCLSFVNSIEDDEEKEFIRAIIIKDLIIGLNLKTITKAYGDDFISHWSVQQAYSFDDHPFPDNTWFALSQKANGTRCTFYLGNFMSRQGKKIYGLDHIKRDIVAFGLEDYFLDGELLRKNVDNQDENTNLRIGTGIVNSDAEKKPELQFVIFDIFPVSSFDGHTSKETYKQRLGLLNDLEKYLKQAYDTPFPNLTVIDRLYEGTDQSKIIYYLDKMDSEGKEGCVLNKDVVYECRRHTGILKVKKFKTIDLRIIGYKEHKHRNKLGAFIVDYKGNPVNVPGFTDEDAISFWNNRTSMVGKIIEVCYKEESENKDTGKQSLQFPKFVRIRDDKNEVSLN